MGETTETYTWLCTTCGAAAPGTEKEYINFCRKHPKKAGCNVVLADETGDTVAPSLADAQYHKGIFPKPYSKTGKSQPDEGTPLKPKAKPAPDGKPLLQAYFRTETVELDPRLKLYHQIFLDEGLIPPKTKIGEFLMGAVETLLEMTGRKLAIVQTTGE